MKNKRNKKGISEYPALTKEQMELLNSRIKQTGEDRSKIEPYDQSPTGKATRYAKKHRLSTAVIIIGIVSVLAILVFFFAGVFMNAQNAPNKNDIRFYIGEDRYTLKYKDAVKDGVLYIDMSKIAEECDITISGNSTSIKYTLPNSEYVRFYSGLDYAVVNGTYVNIGVVPEINNNSCLIPYHFARKVISSGLEFELNTDTNKVIITRVVAGKDKVGNITYEPISFSSDNLEETTVVYNDFGIDNIDEILKSIDPEDASKKKYLLLVNHEHPITSSYIPDDLEILTCPTNPVNTDDYYKLRRDVAIALTAMMDAAANSGVTGLQVSSTYRSYERQEYLFDYYIESKMKSTGMSYTQAEKEVLKTLALPGHSEHQTGLSIDFVQGTSSLTEKFENSTAFAWLSENAHKFGFILRYPKDKVSITGYDYEPWHYRFVGRTVASIIYERGVCYEEYLSN